MSTNYYWNPAHMPVGEHPEDSIHRHIGIASGAGKYCWDCGTTLCLDGTSKVHHGGSRWTKTCPGCGKTPDDRDGRKGVSGCMSFTWTLMKHKRTIEASRGSFKNIIVDEYGKQYTAMDFLDFLKGCPIVFQLPVEFC